MLKNEEKNLGISFLWLRLILYHFDCLALKIRFSGIRKNRGLQKSQFLEAVGAYCT